MKIVVDRLQCSSLGMCESVAPELFEVAQDGALVVLNACPAAELRDLAEEAVESCPTGALTIVD